MFVPTMTIPEAIAEASRDLVSVQRKLAHTIQEQERAHRKNRRGGDIVGHFTYTSPLQNNWLYVITTNKKQSFHSVLMWFYAADGLTGLQLCSEGLPYIYPPHFFKRFRERSGEGDTDAEQNLRNYFFRNPSPCTMYTDKLHLGFPAILGAMPDGYVLGTAHADEGYMRCRTFISHAEAFKNQQEHWEGLEAARQLRERFPVLFAQVRAQELARKAA